MLDEMDMFYNFYISNDAGKFITIRIPLWLYIRLKNDPE